MAADSPKKQKHPYGALLWGTFGALCAFRALYRPWRTLVKDGFASRCSGDGSCDPSMTITSFQGQTEVYCPVRGVVAVSQPGRILIIPSDQAVVLEYNGAPTSFLAQMHSGDAVGAGEQIGLASQFTFAVWTLTRNQAGQPAMGAAIEPASWLTTHGAKISAKFHVPSQQAAWCSTGRKLVVPQTIASQCGTVLPAPSGYALLPMSVTMG
jgi:hypothetical protein